MVAILTMNAADLSLQNLNAINYTKTGTFIFSNYLTPYFNSLNENEIILSVKQNYTFDELIKPYIKNNQIRQKIINLINN